LTSNLRRHARSPPFPYTTLFRSETLEAGDAVAIAGMPDLEAVDVAFLLVDPYSFPAEPLLDQIAEDQPGLPVLGGLASAGGGPGDRKSTRLNSSHDQISYAVSCS